MRICLVNLKLWPSKRQHFCASAKPCKCVCVRNTIECVSVVVVYVHDKCTWFVILRNFFRWQHNYQKCSEKGIEKRSNRDFVICTGIVCTSLTHAHSFSAQKGRMSKMSVACRINVLLAIKMPKVFESKYL